MYKRQGSDFLWVLAAAFGAAFFALPCGAGLTWAPRAAVLAATVLAGAALGGAALTGAALTAAVLMGTDFFPAGPAGVGPWEDPWEDPWARLGAGAGALLGLAMTWTLAVLLGVTRCGAAL